jgi:hypothetical protein
VLAPKDLAKLSVGKPYRESSNIDENVIFTKSQDKTGERRVLDQVGCR